MKTARSMNRFLIGGLVALCAACVLAISFGWFYVIRMSDQVSVVNTDIQNSRRESDKLSELSIRFQRVSSQKSAVYGSIPTVKDESSFMADLEATAKKNGLIITSSVVGNSQTKATNTGDFSQTVNKTEYYELPIKYEVSGLYGNFANFVSDLSLLRRLNTVNDIAVTADLSDKAVTNKVKATFNVIIYVKK